VYGSSTPLKPFEKLPSFINFQITATSYNSYENLLQKYHDFHIIYNHLQKYNYCRREFEVHAVALESCSRLKNQKAVIL
jgi:hypothetical protein